MTSKKYTQPAVGFYTEKKGRKRVVKPITEPQRKWARARMKVHVVAFDRRIAYAFAKLIRSQEDIKKLEGILTDEEIAEIIRMLPRKRITNRQFMKELIKAYKEELEKRGIHQNDWIPLEALVNKLSHRLQIPPEEVIKKIDETSKEYWPNIGLQLFTLGDYKRYNIESQQFTHIHIKTNKIKSKIA